MKRKEKVFSRLSNETDIDLSNETDIDISVEDCVAGMKRIASEGVNIVVTSPPYNIGMTYRTYADRRPRGEYLQWTATWVGEVWRVLSEEGSFFLNVGATAKNPLFPHEILLIATKAGFVLQNTFHWIKAMSLELPDGRILSQGHFRPIQSRFFVNHCHEYVFHLSKSGRTPVDRKAVGVPYVDKSNIRRWRHTNGKDRRCRGNVWFIPYPTIRSRQKERPHPATFPVELAERCLLLHGSRGAVVMDPFSGIGSTVRAAVRTGSARFIGFEIDAEYAARGKRLGEEERKAE